MTAPPSTDRLSFREWTADDLDAFHLICTDPAVMRFVGDDQCWSRAISRRFIERAIALSASEGFCRWPLIHSADSTLIGFCGFVNSDAGPEIGWRLAADYWGLGLATEAARAVLKHGFETLGFQRVMATVQAPNQASIRVVEKLGMKAERRVERTGREIIVFALGAGV